MIQQTYGQQREMFPTTTYEAYAWHRRRLSAEALRFFFPRAEQFERRLQEEAK